MFVNLWTDLAVSSISFTCTLLPNLSLYGLSLNSKVEKIETGICYRMERMGWYGLGMKKWDEMD